MGYERRFWAVMASVMLLWSCAEGGTPGPRGDAGPADMDGGVEVDGGECVEDSDCPDDGVFCNGTLACVEGQCQAMDVPTCNDGVGCTRDECNPMSDMCENIPENSACPPDTVCYTGSGCAAAPPCEFDTDCTGDGVFCNGVEVCVEGMCLSPMEGRTCDDMNSCTVDMCVESMGDCVAMPYDDFLTNPMHCGTGANDCVMCPEPPPEGHALPTCMDGMCGFVCEEGWFDADMDPSNWCEADCLPGSGLDDPDDAFADTNCDGIDGDEARAIFVAVTGRDTNPGTRADPKRTLQAGILAAAAMGYDVYVSVGVYDLTSTLELADGVSVYGGYDASMGWVRNNSNLVELNGLQTAVRAQNITSPTTIDRINVRSRSNLTPGGASIGVHAIDAPGLTWRISEVTAGDGGTGGNGTTGGMGGSGDRGADSVGGIEYDADVDCFFCSCGAPRPGRPSGGDSDCLRTGGYGGRGGLNDGSGEAGEGGGVRGSAGSAGGPGSGGGSGGNGAVGGPGADGAGGVGSGSVVGDAWVAGNGADGVAGEHGQGGGGGGGGGGDTSLGCQTYGDTGASGGGGGCGGGAGTSGGGGGGSIAFLLVRSSMTFENVVITTGFGGDGGNGGGGGPGGPGGPGGAGSGEPGWGGTRDDDNQGRGGPGGDGGAGGRGGAGGGGAGGPSVGILRDTASSISTSLVTYTLGNGGNGGSSPGNNGDRGVRMNELEI